MKKAISCLLVSAMLGAAAFSMAACNDASGMLTKEPNVGISQGASESIGSYAQTAYYEQEKGGDVKIPFEAEHIQKISFMYRVLSSDDWSFKNDTITVKGRVFEKETAGEKRLRVFVDNQYVEISLRIVTKVIYTTEDFNTIRTNLNGVFVLGNDIDFGNETFWPIGKPVAQGESTGIFEGIFDGMGYAVKNITVHALDRGEGEDGEGQGPSLGNAQQNGRNYNNGIFMQTSGNAQIINTNFVNITVKAQGLSGAIVGSNGGLIKNCRVTCALESHGYYERAGGITGVNGSNDAAGRIENCVVFYEWTGDSPARGFADWNNGTIKNSFAALKDDYVFHMGYNSETQSIPADFDYDDFITQENFLTYGFGWFTTPAFPGAMDTSSGIYYKNGDIENSDVVRKEFMLDPNNFPEEDGWDRSVWHFEYGMYPTLRIQQR